MSLLFTLKKQFKKNVYFWFLWTTFENLTCVIGGELGEDLGTNYVLEKSQTLKVPKHKVERT